MDNLNDTRHQRTKESGITDTTTPVNTSFGLSFAMPEPGHKIGPNRILELIAEGGMANVYKVWHEGLEIVRAIKILKPGFNEESKQRLQTEAKISAHLNHPNIVEIYGVNFWKDTVPYIEMEYIDGLSLKDSLKYHKRTHYSFAISIGYFVCNALHYAHSQVFTLYGKTYQGVIHRDIKPANILISSSGAVKLADFGIAKPSEISLHTVGHKVMGTFSYLSPEQLNGEALDRRCDIYSLGTVLYEIITGVKAFPQKDLNELIQKKMRNEFKPIDTFDIDCPKQLCAILEKSTELKKGKRYATALEFAQDLTDLLKKISDKTPEYILSSYMQNPEAIPKIGRKKRSSIPLIAFLSSAFFAVLAMVLMLLWSNRHRESESKGFNNAQETSNLTDTAMASLFPETVAPTDLSQKDTQPTATNTEKNGHPSTPSVFEQVRGGLFAAHKGNFKDAILRLEPAMKKKMPDSLRTAVVVRLLEAYVNVKKFLDAKNLASTEFIRDGYFHLLCGKTYLALGEFDRAIESFGNAQTIPSRMHRSTLREATYLWAKTLDKKYQSKPNYENKRSALRSWQQFSKAFCDDMRAEGNCTEAVERILVLGK